MIRIVTDSTSYLPHDLVQRYHIGLVTLKVQLGPKSYGDDLSDIDRREFYQRLATASDLPTTSQPPSTEFKAACLKIHDQDPAAEILVVTVSSKLSGTYHSALVAAAQLPRLAITVFDSQSVALGAGLMVITAAEMAGRGRSLADILTRLEQMRRQISIVLVVDKLEYLKRGGRIGAAAAFLGALLDSKPLLTLTDGSLQPLARVRTRPKAISRLLLELEHKLAAPGQPVQAAVMHVAAEADMAKLAASMQERFNITRLFTSELGPVIGAHVGPGTLGAGICPEPGFQPRQFTKQAA